MLVSTLFNRLTQTRSAITDEFSGVTRDRNYGKVNWSGKDFSIIDTGGYVENTEDILRKKLWKSRIWQLRNHVVFFL